MPGRLDTGYRVEDLATPTAFADAALCGLAADELPAILPGPSGRHAVTPEGPRFAVEVSPGAITLVASDLPRRDRTIADRQDADARDATRNLRFRCDCVQRRGPLSPFEYPNPNAGPGESDWVPCSHSEVIPTREGEGLPGITEWSRKSRARMVHRVACIDWAPLWRLGLPAMVTLTYPGEWEAFAPNARTVKGHRRAFGLRYKRMFGAPPPGLWKLEFQRRGAPHFHWLLPIPRVWRRRVTLTWAEGDALRSEQVKAGTPVTLTTFRRWVGMVWCDIIGRRESDILEEWLALGMGLEEALRLYAEQMTRSRRAGTAVDLREGLRMRDPKRIAVYFLKHATPGSRSDKEYQHRVPVAWSRDRGPGRFWGYEVVEVIAARRYLRPRDYVTARRFLRRLSEHRQGARPVCTTGRLTGGWVLCNDGPGLGALLARALAELARGDHAAAAADAVIAGGVHPSIARHMLGLPYAGTRGVWV